MIKKLLLLINRYRIDLIFLLIVAAVVIVAWHGVLNQIIEGEGYYYFSPANALISPEGHLTDLLHEYDNFPRISHYFLQLLFKGDIQGYMNFQFIVMLLVHTSFYIFVRFITKKPWLALIAAVYFAANYSGNYQFYARGHFQWFTQRVPELFPIFISAALLLSYIQSRRLVLYISSLVFFLFAILTSHYTSIIMPLFPALTISSALIIARGKRERLILALLGVPFILINYLIVSGSALSFSTIKPHQSFLESFVSIPDAPLQMLHQLVVITVPFSLLKLISTYFKVALSPLIYDLLIPILLLHLIAIVVLIKRRFEYLHIYIGIFIALLGVLFLNVYVKRTNLFNEIEQGRYYYIPGMYIGIMYASLLYSVLLQGFKKNRFSVLRFSTLVLFLLLWTIPNVYLISGKVSSSQYQYTGGRVALDKLKQLQPNLPPNSVILLPNPLMPGGADFLTKNYSNGKTTFLYIDSKWQEVLPADFDPKNLFVFDYNEEYKLGGRSRIKLIELVDRSDEYRKKIK